MLRGDVADAALGVDAILWRDREQAGGIAARLDGREHDIGRNIDRRPDIGEAGIRAKDEGALRDESDYIFERALRAEDGLRDAALAGDALSLRRFMRGAQQEQAFIASLPERVEDNGETLRRPDAARFLRSDGDGSPGVSA